MSRIEEALRRSGAAGARPVPAATVVPEAQPAASAAVEGDSAWEFTAEEAEAAQPVATGGPAAPARRPASIDPPRLAVAEATSSPSAGGGRLFANASAALSEKLVVTSSMPSHLLEEYRKLAATLHHAQQDRGIKIVMVASAAPNEGKTLTASNLALTLSESYQRRVLLIDADLRHPSLHEAFQVPSLSGLSDGLRTPDERRLNLIQLSSALTLLPGGRPDFDPMSVLSGARMKKVLAEAAENFDWVILDTPPVGLLPDANLLAAMVDAALLVVRAESTPYAAVKRALDTIGRDRILGVVLNAVEKPRDAHPYGYGYNYYSGSSGGR